MNEQSSDLDLIKQLLPHREGMLFIEKILELNETSSRCVVRVGSGCITAIHRTSVCTSVGLEYMAQASGLIIGKRAPKNQAQSAVGMLIAVRGLISKCNQFDLGQMIEARSQLSAAGNDTAIFEAELVDSKSAGWLMGARLTIHHNQQA